MWYAENSGLDYSTAIRASRGINVFVLLPIRKESYAVIGYDWFNFTSGRWNSSMGWSTPQEAIKCYEDMGYTIENTEIIIH